MALLKCQFLQVPILVLGFEVLKMTLWEPQLHYDGRVRIYDGNVSWFGKYDTVFILHDSVFPTYPKNHDTKM